MTATSRPDPAGCTSRLAASEATLADERGQGTESRPGEERRNPPRASPPRRACRLTGDSRHRLVRVKAAVSQQHGNFASSRFGGEAAICFSWKAAVFELLALRALGQRVRWGL